MLLCEDLALRSRLLRDGAAEPARCAEYQADGVPCVDPARDCERCDRARPTERLHATRRHAAAIRGHARHV